MTITPDVGAQSKLFERMTIGNGKIQLDHRVILAPLTRNRGTPLSEESTAENPNRIWLPNDLMAEYYAQRASKGGLLITEGVPPSLEVRARNVTSDPSDGLHGTRHQIAFDDLLATNAPLRRQPLSIPQPGVPSGVLPLQCRSSKCRMGLNLQTDDAAFLGGVISLTRPTGLSIMDIDREFLKE